MQTYAAHIEQKLKDECFSRLYEEERQMAELAVRTILASDRSGKSQKDLLEDETNSQSNGDANWLN